MTRTYSESTSASLEVGGIQTVITTRLSCHANDRPEIVPSFRRTSFSRRTKSKGYKLEYGTLGRNRIADQLRDKLLVSLDLGVQSISWILLVLMCSWFSRSVTGILL